MELELFADCACLPRFCRNPTPKPCSQHDAGTFTVVNQDEQNPIPVMVSVLQCGVLSMKGLEVGAFENLV